MRSHTSPVSSDLPSQATLGPVSTSAALRTNRTLSTKPHFFALILDRFRTVFSRKWLNISWVYVTVCSCYRDQVLSPYSVSFSVAVIRAFPTRGSQKKKFFFQIKSTNTAKKTLFAKLSIRNRMFMLPWPNVLARNAGVHASQKCCVNTFHPSLFENIGGSQINAYLGNPVSASKPAPEQVCSSYRKSSFSIQYN